MVSLLQRCIDFYTALYIVLLGLRQCPHLRGACVSFIERFHSIIVFDVFENTYLHYTSDGMNL